MERRVQASRFLLSRLRSAALTVLALVFAGTVAFKLVGGPDWTWLDALYMSVVTISTVGYEEIHALDDTGRIVAMFVILGGVGALFYALTSAAEAVVEGRVLWRRRVAKQIDRLEKHFIICGFGRVGQAIASELRAHRVPYAVVSLDEHEGLDEPLIVGDATNDEVLERAGLSRARALVVVLGSDADNTYTVLAARTRRPDLFIVARSGAARSAKMLEAAGADRVINPYERGGVIMAQVMMRPRLVDFLEEVGRGTGIEASFEEIEISPGSALVGQSLKESPIRRELDVIVTAIRRDDGSSVFNPPPDEVIREGDLLIVIGKAIGLDKLSTLARAT